MGQDPLVVLLSALADPTSRVVEPVFDVVYVMVKIHGFVESAIRLFFRLGLSAEQIMSRMIDL